MARGRMLATTIADDKRFNALPVDAALVYFDGDSTAESGWSDSR